MDDIIEMIVEIFVEGLGELIESLATSKRVPLVIRIITMLIISACLFALIVVGIYGVINAKNVPTKILLGFVGAVGLLLLVLFQRKWWKSILTK